MVAWDGKLFQIVNSGDGNIWMQSEQGSITPLEYAKFNELVRIGAIRNGAGVHPEKRPRFAGCFRTRARQHMKTPHYGINK